MASPNILIDPYETLKKFYESESNVKIFLENKLDYSKNILSDDFLKDNEFKTQDISSRLKTKILSNSKDLNNPDIFMICYGGLTERTIFAAKKLLIEDEIETSIIVPSKIYPLDKELKEYLSKINKPMLILEDNYTDNGWGSYILNILSEENEFLNFKNVKIIGVKKSIIPANIAKEKKHFVDEEKILEHSRKLLL